MIIFALGLRMEQKWYAPNMGLLTTPAAGATQGLQQAPAVSGQVRREDRENQAEI